MEALSVGARVRALRERAGIQSQDLARAVDLDPSAMSNIERGKRGVKTEELTRIAAALRVSPLAILDEGSLLARLPVAPRADAGTPLESPAFMRLTALAELHEVLADEKIPPSPQLDDVPAVDEAAWLQAANQLAAWTRERLGPLAEGDERFFGLAKAIEEKLGVDVLVEDFEDDPLWGASITDRAFPFVFVNAKQPTTRALFTLAHELAHVLAGDGEVMTLDVDLTAHDDRERFANAFAATLLMPSDEVRGVVQEFGRTAEALARMMLRFGVSYESLIYRLHNLRLINAHGRDQLQARGWRSVVIDGDADVKAALLTRLGARPEYKPPRWLTSRAAEGYADGILSIRPLAGLLGVDPEEFLDRISIMEQDARDTVEMQYEDGVDEITDEEAFGGSPT
jgi:Zn-dependent peptidase ImmA (M78 family)/DNA-binding XRE family transcriptional regulator